MKRWKQFPGIFRRRILLTGLTGFGCGAIAAVVYFVSKDRTLLVLGCIILLICLYKVFSFWICAAGGHYHVLSGLCHISKGYSPLRFQRIEVTTDTGITATLLIDKKAEIRNGLRYSFYFQGKEKPETGNTKLDAAFLADSLIGIETLWL